MSIGSSTATQTSTPLLQRLVRVEEVKDSASKPVHLPDHDSVELAHCE